MKKIGVYTSGGDAPGMNAAIRAVVRTCHAFNVEVVGIMNGYVGMLEQKYLNLSPRDMANIVQRGGTILKTGRSKDFLKPEFRKKAADFLKQLNIEGLVCIGGDGSFRGAQLLYQEHQIPVIGISGTIDNDVYGTDDTIGFDTAVNTALDAIDKIRDTADSHDRIFIVEVMGRTSSFIASQVGLAGGAEEILTDDNNIPLDQIIEKLKDARARGKTSSILITTEGKKPGHSYSLAEEIKNQTHFDAKVCILGHQQRGGRPTAHDRILASRLGAEAVKQLLKGKKNIMIGTEGQNLIEISLDTVTQNQKPNENSLIELARLLSV